MPEHRSDNAKGNLEHDDQRLGVKAEHDGDDDKDDVHRKPGEILPDHGHGGHKEAPGIPSACGLKCDAEWDREGIAGRASSLFCQGSSQGGCPFGTGWVQ